MVPLYPSSSRLAGRAPRHPRWEVIPSRALSVGPPIELLLYTAGTLDEVRYHRFDENDGYLRQLSAAWSEGLKELFMKLPRFEWEAG